mmetsp:Transcript_77363/g.230468  ORF Transcript_77363/g.230468 Transcript_77363/m.230468 type:complete len:286 (-) Transcript_77363:571-1428(-)
MPGEGSAVRRPQRLEACMEGKLTDFATPDAAALTLGALSSSASLLFGPRARSARTSPGCTAKYRMLSFSERSRWKRPPPKSLRTLRALLRAWTGRPMLPSPGLLPSSALGILPLSGRGTLLLWDLGIELSDGSGWSRPAFSEGKWLAPAEVQTEVWSRSWRRPSTTALGKSLSCSMVTTSTSQGEDLATAVKAKRDLKGTAPKTPPLISTRSLLKPFPGSRGFPSAPSGKVCVWNSTEPLQTKYMQPSPTCPCSMKTWFMGTVFFTKWFRVCPALLSPICRMPGT